MKNTFSLTSLKHFIIFFLSVYIPQSISAQIKVEDNSNVIIGTYDSPQASAKLEVNSETKGFLVPRWDFDQLEESESLGMVTDGLLVYVQDLSDSLRGFWYYDAIQAKWLKLFGGCSTP